MLARLLRSPWTWAVVALLVRIAYLALGPGFDVQPYSDSVDYHRLAAHLASGRGFTLGPEDALYPTTFRPPLLPMLVAPLYWLFGPHYLATLLFQVVLSALTVPMAAALARETLGDRAARITAPAVALWPGLIFFSGVLLTETLAILLTVVALLLAARAFTRGGLPLALATGMAFGLDALARPTALPIAALTLAWIVLLAPRPPGSRAREAACLVVGLVLCVLPWSARNHAVTGRWVPITSGGGCALYDSNNELVVDTPELRGGARSLRQVEPYAAAFHGLDEVGIDSLSAVRGRAFLAEHRALWPRLAAWKLARMFRLTGEAGARAGPDPIAWSWGPWAPLALLGFARALARPRAAAAVLALAVLAQAALAVVYWGSLRMRAPIEPVLIALGAGTLGWLWERIRKPRYSSR